MRDEMEHKQVDNEKVVLVLPEQKEDQLNENP